MKLQHMNGEVLVGGLWVNVNDLHDDEVPAPAGLVWVRGVLLSERAAGEELQSNQARARLMAAVGWANLGE